MTRDAEILTVGDELLRGEVVDSNATWLAGRLWQLGLQVQRITSVGDALDPLVHQLQEACQRCDLLVVSGGLGPTEDDRTTEAVSRATGAPLAVRPEVLQALRERFARAGFTLTPNNEKQAWLPASAILLPNERGTAPGFFLRSGRCHIACLPGVPLELVAMFDAELAPRVQAELGGRPALVRTLKTFGVGESQVDQRLRALLSEMDAGSCRVSIHFRTSFPENHVILVAHPGAETSPAQAEAVISRLEAAVREQIGRYVFGTGETTFSEAVVKALRAAHATLALAESCTGGLAGDLVTRAPGSSEVFQMGVVAYANEVKQGLLQVPAEVLQTHGAVSQACVQAMAQGIRRLSGATYGVAISGIAGPGGGSEERPVGTVHLAVASEREVQHRQRLFPFERQRIKTVAAYAALALLLKQLGRGT